MMNYKYIVLIVSLLFTSLALSAQSDYEAENDGWLVSLDEAYELSQETGKPIMANFTGSDWCGWCKRLTATVFSQDEFTTWADDNVVLLELDYPKRKTVPEEIKQQNAGLQQAFKIRGFPSVWVFDLDKDEAGKFNINAYGKTGYKASVSEFTNEVDGFLGN